MNLSTLSEQSLSLVNQGGGTANLVNSVIVETWLSIVPVAVDATGLGQYRVTIDRTGLSDGTYTGDIVFAFDTNQTLAVSISMQVGEITAAEQLSPVYALLYTVADTIVADVVLAERQPNGNLSYRFENVAPGIYGIIAGSDIDNDVKLCQYAEICGAFPTLSTLQSIEVGTDDITDIDFNATLLNGFTGALSLATDSESGRGSIWELSIGNKPQPTAE